MIQQMLPYLYLVMCSDATKKRFVGAGFLVDIYIYIYILYILRYILRYILFCVSLVNRFKVVVFFDVVRRSVYVEPRSL